MYRYEDEWHPDSDPYDPVPTVYLTEWDVVDETQATIIYQCVDRPWVKPKRVWKRRKHAWCHRSKKDALESYMKRKQRQADILRSQLNATNRRLHIGAEMLMLEGNRDG